MDIRPLRFELTGPAEQIAVDLFRLERFIVPPVRGIERHDPEACRQALKRADGGKELGRQLAKLHPLSLDPAAKPACPVRVLRSRFLIAPAVASDEILIAQGALPRQPAGGPP